MRLFHNGLIGRSGAAVSGKPLVGQEHPEATEDHLWDDPARTH